MRRAEFVVIVKERSTPLLGDRDVERKCGNVRISVGM
jgi:hypothetical protein